MENLQVLYANRRIQEMAGLAGGCDVGERSRNR